MVPRCHTIKTTTNYLELYLVIQPGFYCVSSPNSHAGVASHNDSRNIKSTNANVGNGTYHMHHNSSNHGQELCHLYSSKIQHVRSYPSAIS